MKKRNLLIGAAAVFLLAVTHWFAYNQGVEHAIAQDAPLREELQTMDPFDKLLCEVPVINAAVKCPDDFSRDEIRAWRDETEATVSAAETVTLDYLKKTGDEGKEKLVRREIHKARALLAKLPK